MRRSPGALLPGALILALAVVVTSCTSAARPEPTASSSGSTVPAPVACARASSDLVLAVQRYVDAYGTPLSTSGSTAAANPAGPDDTQLQAAMQATQQTLRDNGCNFDEFRRAFSAGLSAVTTRGPVARAVLLRLTASMTGTGKQSAATVTVRPNEDLPRRLADLPTGSVVVLAAGTYRLTESLALLEGVTIRGAGRDRTVIETTAADAGMLVLTDRRLELRDLTVRHTGKATGDVVVGGATSSLVLTRVRVRGALAAGKAGGNGVLMTSRSGTTRSAGTTLEVTDSTFDHNGASGILLTGAHVASIRQARFEANAGCGVCFSDTSTGAVRKSTFLGNRIGAGVLGHAKPELDSNTFDGGLFGIQASDDATPIVRGARVSGASRAAMIFADRAAGRVDGSICTDVPFGIVVSPKALPLLGDNPTCPVAKGE